MSSCAFYPLELSKLESARDQMTIEREEELANYDEMKTQLAKYKEDVQAVITDPSYLLPFLQPGRLIMVEDHETRWGWGVVVNFQSKRAKVRVSPRVIKKQ
jgi:ATP-dependent RNA helicase DOB1